MRLRNLCAVVTSFGIALAGCGGSSSSGTTTPPPPPPSGVEQNFEALALDTPFDVQGWVIPDDGSAVVAADPIVSTNHVLKISSTNYNFGTIVKLTIPEGKTVGDYASFDYKAYFQAGDLGSKVHMVFISKDKPLGAFGQTPENAAGSFSRTPGASTEWESISLPLSNISQAVEGLTGDVYFAFGFNNKPSDVPATIYYVDDIKLVAK